LWMAKVSLLPVKRRYKHPTAAVNQRTRHEHFIRESQSHVLRQAVEAPRPG
jgi:hypothetical protein